MLGDTAVAVNPTDERYTHLVGKTCILPLVGRELPIVADDYVEMDFGTGAVKMTPAHDPNDFEVAQRHDLEIITVTHDDGTMNENAGPYDGMDPLECRKAVVEKLDTGAEKVSVDSEKLHTFLGAVRYTREKLEKEPRIGVVNGLAWTSVGGETLLAPSATRLPARCRLPTGW